LLRALGYSLTGRTSEKVTFWCWGPANSGKTTLLEFVRYLFGEYSSLLMIETLVTKDMDSSSREDLSDLRSARFVVTSETSQGQRLQEARLKRIVQGQGRIKSIRKYEHAITFAESHKLWFDANFKLVIRGTDDSIWSRFAVIPFGPSIPKSQRDPDLPTKLREEAEGFIAMLVTEACAWYRDGLREQPLAVREAGTQWRTEMDCVRAFIEECCVLGKRNTTLARPLYRTYWQWAENGGEHPMSEKEWAARMEELSEELHFTKQASNKGRIYVGIGKREGEAQ
jgi:putative DNA primase/helicase